MVVLLKPCVVVLSGMPLMGKSALGGELVKMTNLVHVDVDELRQLLFPNPQRLLFKSEVEFALMESCYELLTKNAEWVVEHLRMPVCITGTFSRKEFKEPLKRMWDILTPGFPVGVFLLTASDGKIEQRIERRRREGSPSNIDTMEKFLWAKGFFQPIEFAPVVTIDTSGRYPMQCAGEVMEYLSDLCVW